MPTRYPHHKTLASDECGDQLEGSSKPRLGRASASNVLRHFYVLQVPSRRTTGTLRRIPRSFDYRLCRGGGHPDRLRGHANDVQAAGAERHSVVRPECRLTSCSRCEGTCRAFRVGPEYTIDQIELLTVTSIDIIDSETLATSGRPPQHSPPTVIDPTPIAVSTAAESSALQPTSRQRRGSHSLRSAKWST